MVSVVLSLRSVSGFCASVLLLSLADFSETML